MHGPEPHQVPGITYAWVITLSLISAIANYSHRLAVGRRLIRPFSQFVMDISYSLMAGLITFWFCEESNLSGYQAAALVSLASHQGARLIFLLQNIAYSKFQHVAESPKTE